MADYVARRREFLKNLIADVHSLRERNKRFRGWLERNSPYSAEEKLVNLMRALSEVCAFTPPVRGGE
jgi:hypothetical protein